MEDGRPGPSPVAAPRIGVASRADATLRSPTAGVGYEKPAVFPKLDGVLGMSGSGESGRAAFSLALGKRAVDCIHEDRQGDNR